MNIKTKDLPHTVLIITLFLTSCGGTAQTPVIGSVQPISIKFPIPDSPSLAHDFLTGAEVLSFHNLDEIDENSWNAILTTTGSGTLVLSKTGDENPFLVNLREFKQGEAALILFKFNDTAQFEIEMERGDWDTDSFKRWGLYKTESLEGNVWKGKLPLEPPGIFTGSLTLIPDFWYYALFIIGNDQGIQYVWQKDNPTNTAEFTYGFETGWKDQTWGLIFQVFEGELEIEEFAILAGQLGSQFARTETTTTAASTVKPEPTQPLIYADIIYYNGQILTMNTNMPTVQAIAIFEDSILAVGSNEQILVLENDDTRVVDLSGYTLMPGFIDPHTHIFDSGPSVSGISITEAQRSAIENGVTSIGVFMNENELQTMQTMNQDSSLRLRTNVYLNATGACGDYSGTWYRQFKPTRNFGEILRINGIKIFTDGGTCEYPAVVQETHPGAGLGNLWFTDQQLKDMVMEAHQTGYQVAIHALGDRAIKQAQDAIIYANGGADNLLRHRIEHNYYLNDDLIPRYQENGILLTIFGQFPTCAVLGLSRTNYWKETIARWNELLEANPGIPIAAKSDTPYVGQEIPLLSLYSLTTMQEAASDGTICTPPDWLTERAITIKDALPMLTINAAYVLFRENEVGSIETGKLADLIIVSGNPLETAPEDLINLEVLMTMIGGITEYCAMEHSDLCP